MEIIQKKGSIKHTFTFMDDQFNFAYVDKTGSGDTDLHYADLPKKSSIQIEQKVWLRRVGYVWCGFGGLQLSSAILSGGSASGRSFWLLMGLVCLVASHFSKVTYSVFRSQGGNVFVMHDGNHDLIIEELTSRKKKQLLQWYGEINPQNDLKHEVDKFKWLAEQDVISGEESNAKITQVELLHKGNHAVQSGELN